MTTAVGKLCMSLEDDGLNDSEAKGIEFELDVIGRELRNLVDLLCGWL